MTRKNLIWAVVTAIPLGVLLKMWLVTGGLPYNSDSNESFSAYVQAQSMLHFNPLANAFLTDDATGYHAGAHPFTYTHGANLPRYFSALMYVIGIKSLEWQILISGTISILLSIWFIAKSFPDSFESEPSDSVVSIGLILAVLFAIDFIGVWQFIGSLWRTWHFPLFWGCIWAVRTRARAPFGFVLFFLLFQIEFLFAIFTAIAGFLYVVWTNRFSLRQAFDRSYLGMAAGAIASVLVFIGQLIAFYGWRGFLFDLRTTYVARNTNQITWDTIKEFYEKNAVMMWPSSPNWDFRFTKYLAITWENMALRLSSVVAAAVLASVLLSVVLAIVSYLSPRYRPSATSWRSLNASVGPMLWATVAAYLVIGLTIPGYGLNGYTYRWAPLLVFPVSLALALLIGNLVGLVAESRAAGAFPFLQRHDTAIVAAPVFALCLAVSLAQYAKYPDFVHSPARVLASTYKGRSFVSATTFPHMIAHYTGRWAYYAPAMTFPGNVRLDQTNNWNADRDKNLDYETPEYYLCEVMPYSGPLKCEDVAKQMEALGHAVAERGPSWVIMKLNWNLPPR